jgi:hypothetical protein
MVSVNYFFIKTVLHQHLSQSRTVNSTEVFSSLFMANYYVAIILIILQKFLLS